MGASSWWCSCWSPKVYQTLLSLLADGELEYKGRVYPIKQVVSAVTGLPRVAFTAMHAYRVLTVLGFEVKELKPGELG